MLQLAFDFICNAHGSCNLTEVALSVLCVPALIRALKSFSVGKWFCFEIILVQMSKWENYYVSSQEKKKKGGGGDYFSRENLQSISDDWVTTQIVALPYGRYTNNYFGCKYSKLECYDRLCCDCVCVSMEIWLSKTVPTQMTILSRTKNSHWIAQLGQMWCWQFIPHISFGETDKSLSQGHQKLIRT